MESPFTYDFGYGWLLQWGYVIPIGAGALLAALGWWLSWRRWTVGIGAAVTIWGCLGLFVLHGLGGLNVPMRLPAEGFMIGDAGHFLDIGAGSGRAAIGVLLARPHTRATAIDIYSGFFGIDDNTPARLMANARIAGVQDRIEAVTGDMRTLPFGDASFDAAVSTYAIDHLRRADIPVALGQAARVLKPNGEFLLEIVNQDFWVRLSMPVPHFGLAAHRPQDPREWQRLLEDAGFHILESGTKPATLYWIGRKGLSD